MRGLKVLPVCLVGFALLALAGAVALVDEQGDPWISPEQLYTEWSADPIARVQPNISYSEFYEKFASKHLPVIFSEALTDNPITKWSWEDVEKMMGSQVVPVARVKKRSGADPECDVSWADLCSMPDLSVSTLIKEHILKSEEEGSVGPYLYGHDIEMQSKLPEMFKEYRVFNHFSEDVLGVAEPTSWPTVFLGPKGTQSGLHQDSMATAFTMTVLKGHKQFLVFPQSEADLLCYDEDTTRFNVSAFTPDFSKETGCASAAKAKAFAADLMPGDIVYIPSNFVHAARNLESGIGASQNFIDRASYDSFARYMKEDWHSEIEARDAVDAACLLELINVLQHTNYDPSEVIDASPTVIDIIKSREQAKNLIVEHLKMHEGDSGINETLAYFVAPGNTLESFLGSLNLLEFLPVLQEHAVHLYDVLTVFASKDGIAELHPDDADRWLAVYEFIEIRWARLLHRLGIPQLDRESDDDDDDEHEIEHEDL